MIILPLNKYKQFDKATLCNNAFYFKDMNRIGFIIRDIDDVVIGCSLRAMDEVTKPKWLHRPASIQTGETFYNIHDVAGKYKTVYIVEGITDTLNMINIGRTRSKNSCNNFFKTTQKMRPIWNYTNLGHKFIILGKNKTP